MTTHPASSFGDLADIITDFGNMISISIVDLNNKFTGLENRFTGLDNKFTGLEDRFTELDSKFTGLEAGQKRLEAGLTAVGTDVTKIKIEQHETNRRLGNVENEILAIHSDIKELYDRTPRA